MPGDGLRDLLNREEHGSVEVTLLEAGSHGVSDFLRAGGGQGAFQPITDGDAPFMVLDGEEEEHSAVGGFVADAPGIGQVAGVVRNVCAIERGGW